MKSFLVRPAYCLRGTIALAGDKSIAHRAAILSSLSSGKVSIGNFPRNQDCLWTLRALRKLGIEILSRRGKAIEIFGRGPRGLKKPKGKIFVGDSGTTLRLLLGVLAGQGFSATLTAAPSLSRRPMLRVTLPLRKMGANISARRKAQNLKTEEYPPITVKGESLSGITYKMPVASAQVKSALLLAGLYAQGKTRIIEPLATRDHTERMLRLFRADLKTRNKTIIITGRRKLASPKRIYIPGDISSAGFFLVLASILPDAQITLKNVSLNPTRTGIIRVLKRMGADIRLKAQNAGSKASEPMGDLVVRSSLLKGTRVGKAEIPSLIDELPILMVAACFARGKTVFRGVGELRVKETDRISSMSENLRKMGAKIRIFKSGRSENILVQGLRPLHGASLKSFGDHRTVMSLVVAGLAASNATLLDDVSCISKSFPDFLDSLKKIIRKAKLKGG